MGGIVDGIGDFFSDTSDKLFGNNIPGELKNPRLTSFNAPGMSANFLSPENLQVNRSGEVSDALSGISSAYGTAADEFGALKPLVRPGFGRLTESAIRAVRDARRSTMGDLRQNLARRRVSGSSFGADDLSRTSAEFAKKENELTSQAFINEMAMSQDLVGKQAQAEANSFLQTLNQSNLESNIAATLSSGVTNVLSANAQLIGDMSNSGANRILNTGGVALGAYGASGGFGNPGGGFSNPSAMGYQPPASSFWNTGY